MSVRLEIDDVSWRVADRDVLSGVTLRIRAGEITAVTGRNGAGKSTLLDIVAGLRQPHRGHVRIDDRPLAAWNPRARARVVAHLPQAMRPDLPFLAKELVLMGRYPHTEGWLESDEDRRAVERAMRRTACWHLRGRLVQTLSGGERQRVLLASCLAQSPRLLLLDEPSTHLDIDQQLQTFALLRAECARGATCVAVMHDLNLALRYAARIVVLAHGRVALDTPVTEAAAGADWLTLFSSHLALSTLDTGRTWVTYA